jgi:hypothetical protein
VSLPIAEVLLDKNNNICRPLFFNVFLVAKNKGVETVRETSIFVSTGLFTSG